MSKTFRVVDTRGNASGDDKTVEADTAEAAARLVFGADLVRSGRKSDLVARVYWQLPGAPVNMVRLYTRAAPRRD